MKTRKLSGLKAQHILLTVFACLLAIVPLLEAAPAPRPDIVIILADDLGYGDLGCYGARLVKTPNIDRLAREGMRFTRAYAPYPVCTPSRYGLLTGKHYFRAAGRAWDPERRLLIEPSDPTIASLLKSGGYETACIGKWHLGFGAAGHDFNKPLSPGPLEAGFGYFFGTPNGHGESPCVFVENDRVVGLEKNDPICLPNGEGPRTPVVGGSAALAVYQQADPAELYVEKSTAWIHENKDRPFFLYLAPENVHVPVAPGKRFRKSSNAGDYGDFIQELDWMVGEVLDALEAEGLSDKTLVILGSDNGGMQHRQALDMGHRSNGPLLGQKTDMWEGGTRIPLIARWPGHIPVDTVSSSLLCLTDLLPTIATITGIPLPEDASLDGTDALSLFTSPAPASPPRSGLLTSGIPLPDGSETFAVYDGKWVFLPFQTSRGVTTLWSWGVPLKDFHHENSDYDENGTLRPDAAPAQLYDLAADPEQHTNLYSKYPEAVEKMTRALTQQTQQRHSASKRRAACESEPEVAK